MASSGHRWRQTQAEQVSELLPTLVEPPLARPTDDVTHMATRAEGTGDTQNSSS